MDTTSNNPANVTHERVRERYAQAADSQGCCSASCCSPEDAADRLGYSSADRAAIPADADLGLGCGNPVAIAELRPGDVVVDLGSGAGIDCFLAAERVGPEGRVIGVDMTPAMLNRAREIAAAEGIANVEFREGTIESPPLESEIADVVISNCVVNLSPDKDAVFASAFRALKPGGKLAISDVVAIDEIPDSIRNDVEMLTGCVAGAAPIDAIERSLTAAGFESISVQLSDRSREIVSAWSKDHDLGSYIASARIEARRPA